MRVKTARRFLARNKYRLVIAKINGYTNHLTWRARQCENALRKETR